MSGVVDTSLLYPPDAGIGLGVTIGSFDGSGTFFLNSCAVTGLNVAFVPVVVTK